MFNLKELSRNVRLARIKRSASKVMRTRKQFSARGLMCKECHKSVAQTRFSLCSQCYHKRVTQFQTSGGLYILTESSYNKLKSELRDH